MAVVVPVFNESASIVASCKRILEVVDRYRGRCIMIAVDDGSSDDSAELLSSVETAHEAMVVCRHDINQGYGAALRTGAQRARDLGFEYVAFIDSDLTNPPEDILLMGELASHGHEFIKASRFVPGGRMAGVPPRRQFFSRAGNLVGRLLFLTRVHDVTNGFRAVRTELFLSWPLTERGFPVIVEEMYWALRTGVEPVEFPSVLSARSDDQRRSAFGYDAATILTYLQYPMRSLKDRLVKRRR